MTPFRTFLLLSVAGGLFCTGACTTFNGLNAGDGGPPAAKTDGGHVTMGDDDDDTMPDATMTVDAGGGDSATADADADSGAPVSYLSVAAAAALCTRFQGCNLLSESLEDSLGIPVYQTETVNYSACVDILSAPLPPGRPGLALQTAEIGCIVSAASCTAAKACVADEDLDSNDPRCLGTPNAEVCSKTDVLLCDSDQIQHCGNATYVGSQCLVGTEGGVECVKDNSCPPFQTCVTATVEDYCTTLNGHQQFDCALTGDYCDTVDGGNGEVDCFQAPGEEQTFCGEVDKVTCDAKGRVSVCADTVTSVYDCNALGEKCVSGTSSFSCVPPGAECNPSSVGINVCTGDQISVCIAGVKSMIDCTTFGAHCKTPGVGINSYCAPDTDGGAADAD